jgi:hypothetical protein
MVSIDGMVLLFIYTFSVDNQGNLSTGEGALPISFLNSPLTFLCVAPKNNSIIFVIVIYYYAKIVSNWPNDSSP